MRRFPACATAPYNHRRVHQHVGIFPRCRGENAVNRRAQYGPRARTLDDTPVSIGYIYIDRVGDWPSYLLLVAGKSYKLRTSETCDVTGHDLFLYDIYLNYTFRWYYHFSNMYFKIKEIMLKVLYFPAA